MWAPHGVISTSLLLLSLLLMASLLSAADDERFESAKRKRRGAPKKDDPVIIVGGGLAGLSATIEAVEHGASKVILIDSEKSLGGNSAKASSGINACESNTQAAMGIVDSCERFTTDTLSAGDRENDENLVQVLVEKSSSAVDFLQAAGVNLGDINLCGGHSVPRTHWIPSPMEGKPIPVGFAIISALKKKVESLQAERPNSVEILLQTRVMGLVSWNEYITGVRVKGADGKIAEIDGKAVVLTTGGFSSDKGEEASLLLEYAKDKASFPTTNGAFARGDGVKMARAMGAQVIGMDRVQIHPTAFVDPAAPEENTKFLAAEALRGKGALLLDAKAARFGNELGRRDYLTGRIMQHCEALPASFQGGSGGRAAALMVMNDKAADSFGRPAFNFYALVKKFFVKYANGAELSKALGVEESALSNAFRDYNTHFDKIAAGEKSTDKYDKVVFPVRFSVDEPLYVAVITPALHYTMGGVKINKHAEVFNEVMSKSFKGLYAAGEVAGGVHGGNRLAGNSLLECVVFGRIAGKQAAEVSYAGHSEL